MKQEIRNLLNQRDKEQQERKARAALQQPIGSCRCGRKTFPPHCIVCGGSNVYAKDSNNIRERDEHGNVILYQGYKCRRCSAEFDASMPCGAEPKASRDRGAQGKGLPKGFADALVLELRKRQAERAAEEAAQCAMQGGDAESSPAGESTPKMDSEPGASQQGDTSTGEAPAADWPLPND